MSPIGKIRISVFLLGILICLLVASVNGQQAGGNGNEERRGGRGGPNGQGRRGPGRRGQGGQGGQDGQRGSGYYKNRKFKKFGKIGDFFEESADAPSFCQQKACPKFTVMSQTEDYELRDYDETKWLTVDKPGRFFGRFQMLINYLNGSNAENKKLKIGVPVLKEYVGDNTRPERMLFYTSETNPPAPEDDAVKIVTIPGGLRYVKDFDGYATPKNTTDNKKQLIEKISGWYDDSSYYAAIFNPPFQRTNRYNEIWVLSTLVPN